MYIYIYIYKYIYMYIMDVIMFTGYANMLTKDIMIESG